MQAVKRVENWRASGTLKVISQRATLGLSMPVSSSVEAFFDPATSTITYVVSDPVTKAAAVIDSVLDYNPNSGKTSTETADRVFQFLNEEGLELKWVLETHVHADHISAAPYLKQKTGAKTAIGAQVIRVQKTFSEAYNAGTDLPHTGEQFDVLMEDGATFEVGSLSGRVLHTPGHTPACITYVIEDMAFVGDTLFMPDFGTARCDFPGGDAAELYQSIHKILTLPDETRIFVGHDYAPGGRDYAWETTVAEEKAKNIHVGGGTPQADFVKMRTERDATLDMPRLLLPSVQVNIRAGNFPEPEDNGVTYLKMPVNLF